MPGDSEEEITFYWFLSLLHTTVILLGVAGNLDLANEMKSKIVQLAFAVDARMFPDRQIWQLPRVGGWWQEMRTVRAEWGERDTFKNDLRMSRDTFRYLLQRLEPSIAGSKQMMRDAIDPETRLAIALYWYATGQSFRHIGDLFGVSKQSVGKMVNLVSKAIVDNLMDEAMRFPQTKKDFSRLANTCQQNCEFPLPNCFGVIDGTHIRIIAPQEWTLQF
jgi:hypothetical protein